jgi:hypothetical protein
MQPKIKGATSPFPLRLTPDERALVETVREVYGHAGVEMSLNDTIRHLVRRGGIVPAHTPDAAWAQICEHANGCSDCDAENERIACPEGLFLYRNWRRVSKTREGTLAANSL